LVLHLLLLQLLLQGRLQMVVSPWRADLRWLRVINNNLIKEWETLKQEFAKATSPVNKASIARELSRVGYKGPETGFQGPPPQPQPANIGATTPTAPQAAVQPQVLPNGRVVIYKDGKGFSVPAAQAQDAVKQGYSLTK